MVLAPDVGGRPVGGGDGRDAAQRDHDAGSAQLATDREAAQATVLDSEVTALNLAGRREGPDVVAAEPVVPCKVTLPRKSPKSRFGTLPMILKVVTERASTSPAAQSPAVIDVMAPPAVVTTAVTAAPLTLTWPATVIAPACRSGAGSGGRGSRLRPVRLVRPRAPVAAALLPRAVTSARKLPRSHGLGKDEELLGWLYVGGKLPRSRLGRRRGVDARHHVTRMPKESKGEQLKRSA